MRNTPAHAATGTIATLLLAAACGEPTTGPAIPNAPTPPPASSAGAAPDVPGSPAERSPTTGRRTAVPRTPAPAPPGTPGTPVAAASGGDPDRPGDLVRGYRSVTGTVARVDGWVVLRSAGTTWALLGDRARRLPDGGPVSVAGVRAPVPPGCPADDALTLR